MKTFTKAEFIAAMGTGEEWFEPDPIYVATTVQELADLGAGTVCGTIGNSAFKALALKKYGHRPVRGWYSVADNAMIGMVHIKIQTERTAMKVERTACEAGGSLRFEGPSDQFDGFMVFEVE